MLDFDFSEYGLRTVSPPRFVYGLSRIILLMFCFINLPNFIVCVPLLLEILGCMRIAIACYPDCDVINFKINFILLIKPIFLHYQKVKTKI